VWLLACLMAVVRHQAWPSAVQPVRVTQLLCTCLLQPPRGELSCLGRSAWKQQVSHSCCSCRSRTAAAGDGCNRKHDAPWAALHGWSQYHLHARQLLSTATALVGIPQTNVAL
jgi:hypothetical protein